MLDPRSPAHRLVRFSVFEMDLYSGELRKGGVRVAFQEQPRRILTLLLEHPGELVTREQLRAALWPTDTFVDFEHGLNAAIKRLRDGLGDAADTPQFVETLPRRGYRFIAPVVHENDSPTKRPPGSPGPINWASVSVWAIGMGAIALAIASSLAFRPEMDSDPQVKRFEISLGELVLLKSGLGGHLALSLDGRRTVVAAGPRDFPAQQLYHRRLDQVTFTPIPETKNSTVPFFSPDGEWVGFFAEGHLQKVALSGGVPLTICDSTPVWGATWGDDGTIVFAADRQLYRVPSGGGVPEPLVAQAPENENYFWPVFLPGSRVVLYAAGNADIRSGVRFFVAALDLRTRERRILVERATYPRFASGFLIYAQQASHDARDPFSGGLLAVPLDPVNVTVTGPPRLLVDGVRVGGGGAADYDVSRDGTLVLVPAASAIGTRALQWLTASGAEILSGPPLPMIGPRLSPDDRFAVVQVDAGTRASVSIYDLHRGTQIRMPFDAAASAPVFTPDGRAVTFSSPKDAGNVLASNLWRVPFDASGPAERLTTSDLIQVADGWSPDGTALLFHQLAFGVPRAGFDILALAMGTREPRPLLATPFDERDAALSPDGRWLAYAANDNGRSEVYLQPYPDRGARHLISDDGGDAPAWAKDGRTLFYVHRQSELIAIDVSTAPAFRAGTPRVALRSPDLLSPAAAFGMFGRNYDVARDGRVLVAHRVSKEAPPTGGVQVILNITRELGPRAGLTQGARP